MTHKVIVSENTVFELSDAEWNALIEKGLHQIFIDLPAAINAALFKVRFSS